MPKRKRCQICGILTHQWEIVGITRCWDCGRKARKIERPDLFTEEELKEVSTR